MPHTFNHIPFRIRMRIAEFLCQHISRFAYHLNLLYYAVKDKRFFLNLLYCKRLTPSCSMSIAARI